MSDKRPFALSRRTMLGAAAVAAGGAGLAGGAFVYANETGATNRPGTGCDTNPALPKREFRGSWIATTANVDWPSKPGLDAETQKEEYLRFLEDAKTYGLNAAVTQVRPTGDAFWPSPHEPWSRWLTGEQGQDPGYDPLKFAIEETHKAGLEFHAWLNPYRVTMSTAAGDVGADPTKLVDGHPARENPNWVVEYPKNSDASQLYYNPGIPEVREFVIGAMMHAVDNYDIDAVHFDDYFYPYPVDDEEFDDDDAFAEYGGDFENKADWRRHNIDLLIKDFGSRIKASKPWVGFGVSPFGVWRNKADDDEGSDTESGVATYDDLYADTRKWVREGWLDYIAPQIYWAMSLEIASYTTLIEWWNDVCADVDCALYIGEAAYKVGVDEASPEWKEDPKELANHVAMSRELDNVDGNIYFSATSIREDALNAITIIRDEHYTKPALVPESTHLGGKKPKPPRIKAVEWDDKGASITVQPAEEGKGVNAATWFALYTVTGEIGECAFADAANLVEVVAMRPDDAIADLRWTGERTDDRVFAVTALNRAWQESGPAVSS